MPHGSLAEVMAPDEARPGFTVGDAALLVSRVATRGAVLTVTMLGAVAGGPLLQP